MDEAMETAFGLNDQQMPKMRTGRSLVFQQMALATVVPIAMALVICVAILVRFRAEDRQTSVTKATVASSWIADRLRDTKGDARQRFIEEAAQELNALVGVVSHEGIPQWETRFPGFSIEELRRVVRSDKANERIGEYVLKAAFVPGLQSSAYVVVAVEQDSFDTGSLPAIFLQLGGIVALLLPIGLAFGFFFGTTIARRLARIRSYLTGMTAEDAMGAKALVIFDENTPGGDLVRLEMAASGLAERFKSELVLYRDALEEMRFYDGQRTAFLETLSIELRAPLDAIVNEAERLIDGDAGPMQPSQIEDIEIIRKGGERLLGLVENVGDLSSVIAEGIEYDREPVDVVAVAEEVVRVARWGIGEKEVVLGLEIEEGFRPKIPGNRQRIWQILTNLVGNGVKFTEQGEVRVKLFEREPHDVVIQVIDTGPGIPVGEHDDIFDPFTQRGDRRNRRRGTGLGLAISKRLVELHSGEITVRSKEEEGSVFTVVLPMEP